MSCATMRSKYSGPLAIMRTLVSLITLALAACGPAPQNLESDGPAAVAASDRPTDLSGEWLLVEMNGRPAPRTRDPQDHHHPITASVGATSFRAQSQCVPIWRRYRVEDGVLKMSNLNPGAMCARGLSDWETEFGRTLSAVDRAERTSDRLVLTGPEARLVFAAAPSLPQPRFLGRWRLHAVHGRRAGGPPLEIEVSADEIRPDVCVLAGWRYLQEGPLLETTPIPAAVCERTLTPEEVRFGAFMDQAHRATLLPDGALVLDSPAEQFEFRRVD